MKKLLALANLLLLLTSAFAQGPASSAGGGFGGGGAGGFGGGGGGGFGGAQGGVGGPSGRDNFDKANLDRPDSDEDPGLWTVKKAILTPGDRVEFKFALEKGQVLLASAVSDAFDPALSVELGGKELKKNDDREEGDQSPFMNFRAPAKGEYLLKVLSYRSVAGGQFVARWRVLTPTDFTTTERSDIIHAVTREQNQMRLIARLSLEKGKIYDFRGISVEGNPYAKYSEVRRVVGPTGVQSLDFERVTSDSGSEIYEAKATGDFLVEYPVYLSDRICGDFRMVPRLASKAIGSVTVALEAGSRAIVEWPVTEGQILSTKIQGENINLVGSMHGSTEQSQSISLVNGWVAFRTNVDSESEIVRSFTANGTFRLFVVSGSSQSVTIENTDKIPEWNPGIAISQQLKIGGSPIFLYHATKSELVRVSAEGASFLPVLEIFRPNGQRANALFDRQKLKVGDDLYFPDAGVFLVRFSCSGDGGSGAFTLKRDLLPAAPYQLGTAKTTPVGGQELALFDVNMVAGKQYELVLQGDYYNVTADLLDINGTFLLRQQLLFGGTRTVLFQPLVTGSHRLWFRGNSANLKFLLREYKVPTVDGG